IQYLRFIFAKRETNSSVLDPIEKLGIICLALLDEVERNGQIVAGGQAGYFEASVLVGPGGSNMARRRLPLLAIACKDDRPIVLRRVAAAVGNETGYFRDSIRELDFDLGDVLVRLHVDAGIRHIVALMPDRFENPSGGLSHHVDSRGAGSPLDWKGPVFADRTPRPRRAEHDAAGWRRRWHDANPRRPQRLCGRRV